MVGEAFHRVVQSTPAENSDALGKELKLTAGDSGFFKYPRLHKHAAYGIFLSAAAEFLSWRICFFEPGKEELRFDPPARPPRSK